jgi:hypothetical protein
MSAFRSGIVWISPSEGFDGDVLKAGVRIFRSLRIKKQKSTD